MARVSLVLPLAPGTFLVPGAVEKLHGGLVDAGHTVEVFGVVDPRSPGFPLVPGSWWRAFQADEPGLASSALAGLQQATGDVLVVLDHERGYTLDEVRRTIEPIERQEADLVIASRNLAAAGGEVRPPRLAAWAGLATRRFLGSSDLLSGLVALNPALIRSAALEPLGSNFTLELLARTGGRRQDLAVGRRRRAARRPIQIDDLRHLKRLGDHKFGNFSRLIQFCAVGASGMVVDLSCYALFQWLLGRTGLATMTAPLVGGPLALAVAGALAIAVALTWNFSLNRRLTFSYARRGSLIGQFCGYALSNALGIALSFTLRLLLPRQFTFFDRHRLAAAVVGIVAATGISFSMARWFVFARRPSEPDTDDRGSETEPGFDDSAILDALETSGDGSVHQARSTAVSSFEAS